MRCRWFPLIMVVLLLGLLILPGCGGSQSGKNPSSAESSTVGANTPKPSEQPKSVETVSDKYGKKDWIPSGVFAEYIAKVRKDKTEPWYHCLDRIPEVRKGNEGRVGIIVVDITPSEKDKTEKILTFYTEAALGCPDPKIDKLVILDKKGNILVEKKSK